jgi:metal-dependent HD superfamily phosphatase/phosphodiesterase
MGVLESIEESPLRKEPGIVRMEATVLLAQGRAAEGYHDTVCEIQSISKRSVGMLYQIALA